MLKSLSISLLLVLVFTGCVFDDLSKCPRQNFSFFYSADGDDNLIAWHITSAQLFVYDDKGAIVHSETVPETALQPGVNFEISKQLLAGSYTVVCWGNVRENSKITSENLKNTGRIQAPAFLEKNKEIKSNDPLYFAMKTIEVRGGMNAQADIIEFKSAHIKFEVFVKGLKSENEAIPKLEISNLMPQYDFEMKSTQEFKTSYFPEMTKEQDEKAKTIFVGRTNVLRFDKDNKIEVNLINPKDNTSLLPDAKPITLERILELALQAPHSKAIDLTKNEVYVPLYIYFDLDLKMQVTVGAWAVKDLIPGVNKK